MAATLTTKPENDAAKTADRSGKYLTFQVGAEEFGIRVQSVREILGVQEITSVPQTPGYLKGVINLRGKVTPVVDLRLKFGLVETEYTQRTCIIVVQVAGTAAPRLIGIIVDGVAEVLNVAAADIEDTPDFGDGQAAAYLLGMAKIKDRIKILLDIDLVLGAREVAGLEAVLA